MLVYVPEVEEDTDLAKWERQAVSRGAHLLDEVEVEWWTKVDLEEFEMESSFSDILGQVYGGYYAALKLVHIEHDNSPEFGFDSSIDSASPASDRSFIRLTSYWIEEVKERLERCGS